MRIIAGKWRGTRLFGGKCKDVRPLTDRIKESVFGILGAEVEQSHILDLFAGSGSFGIEALSRGAEYIVFVDISRSVTEILRKNLEKIKSEADQYKIISRDVWVSIKLLSRQPQHYDIIFADPPFRRPISERLLKSLSYYDLLKRKGILIFRHHKREQVPESIEDLVLFRQEIYGDSVVKFYQKEKENENSRLPRDI